MLFLKEKKYQEAIVQLDLSIELALEVNNILVAVGSHRTLAEVYSEIGDEKLEKRHIEKVEELESETRIAKEKMLARRSRFNH